MGTSSKTINTGIDGLVHLVDTKGKLTFKDAAKLLGVNVGTIEEWAQFLSDERVIEVQYNFRNPILQRIEFTEDQKKKVTEHFQNDTKAFNTRLQSMTSFMDQLDHQIGKVHDIIDSLENHMDNKVDDVKTDLRKIYDLEQQQVQYKEHMLDAKKRIEAKLAQIDKHLADERVKYSRYTAEEQQALAKEKELYDTAHDYLERVKNEQKVLEEKLVEVNKTADTIEKSIKKYTKGIQASEERIISVKKKHDQLVTDLTKEYQLIKSLLEKNKQVEQEYRTKISETTKELEKYEHHLEKKTKGAHNLPETIQHLLENKTKIHDMIANLRHEEEEIKNKLNNLQQRSKVIRYKVGSEEYAAQLKQLHTAMDEVVQKRNSFEKKIEELVKILHPKKR